MPMRLEVKICGVRSPEVIAAAASGSARLIGMVFFAKSPRAVTPAIARDLARQVPTGVRLVGLFVDPDDETLDQTIRQVPLDMIQLHGMESADRVAEIRSHYAMPIIKAIRVATAEDIDHAAPYAAVADRLLFDAKPPPGVSSLPGGTGLSFDWTLMAGRTWPVPWMLAGGLSSANLSDAVHKSGAHSVDVSSGVEERPGHKTPRLVQDFLSTAASL